MKLLYLPHEYSQQRQREKKVNVYPIRLSMEASFYASQRHIVHWGKYNKNERYDRVITEPEMLPFLDLPPADRILTDGKNKKYQRNGNFKYTPGTYIQSASGCSWGKCSFCIEEGVPRELRPLKEVIREIELCKEQGYKEIFDDSATFPSGMWLEQFCKHAPKGMVYGCNMRMDNVDHAMMKNAGFRMVLFGLESANQPTLNIIKKGKRIEDIEYIIKAAKAGLEPHVAVMFGFPWEADDDALHTLHTLHYLLRKGYAKTAQASFYTPKIGVQGNGLHKKYIKKIYDVKYSPEFWFNQLKGIKDFNDIKYLWRKIKAGLSW